MAIKLTPQELNTYVKGSAKQGFSFSAMAGTLGVSEQELSRELAATGWTPKGIAALKKGPTFWQSILDQLGQSAVFFVPGSVAAGLETGAAGAGAAEAGAGGAAAGGAGAAGAASTAANVAKGVVGSLTVASLFTNTNLWAGLGMTLLGAFLILFGIVKLSGADVTAVAKRIV